MLLITKKRILANCRFLRIERHANTGDDTTARLRGSNVAAISHLGSSGPLLPQVRGDPGSGMLLHI